MSTSLLCEHFYRSPNSRLYCAALFSCSVILTTIIAFKFVQFVRKRRQSHQVFKLGNVPQVSETPGLFGGNLLDTLSHDDNTKRLHRLHLKLGKTFGLFYGPDAWAMTVDLDLLQRVFVTEGSTHVDITQLRLPFVTEINESLAQVRGDKWRRARRVMSPSFTMRHMKSDNVFGDITKVCDLFMDFIKAHEQAKTAREEVKGTGGVVVDVHYAFKKYSLEVIFRVAFGREYKDRLVPHEQDKLIDLLNKGSHMLSGPFVQAGIMFDWAQRYLGLCAPLTPLGTVISYVHATIDESLAKRRAILKAKSEKQRDANNQERKAIDSLIERADSGDISSETLKANLFFMLLAGYETSANTLAFLFYFLASNQEVQERLRQSILSQQDGGEYLDWVIQETLRLYPGVPVAIGRVLEHDIQHKGQTFFKGTTVVADIWSIHRWPEYWRGASDANGGGDDDDLDRFRPERFGEPIPEGVSAARFFAFGIGPRYCIGQNLAISETKAIVQRILSKYRVSLSASSPRELDAVSPNFLHYIIKHSIDLEFIEISSL